MLYTNIVNSYVNVNNVNMKGDKKSNKSINMSFRCTKEVGNKVELPYIASQNKLALLVEVGSVALPTIEHIQIKYGIPKKPYPKT